MIFNSELQHTEFLKKSFCVLLREAFKLPELPAEFRYTEDEKTSKVGIYIAYPIRAEKFPLMVVSTGPVDYSVKMFDSEIVDEVRDNAGVITSLQRVAPIMTPVIINIHALTTQDRDRVFDITAFLIRRIFVERFAREGIAYTKIDVSADIEESWMNQVVYGKTITVHCYTEIQEEVPQSLIAAINTIELTGIVAVQ